MMKEYKIKYNNLNEFTIIISRETRPGIDLLVCIINVRSLYLWGTFMKYSQCFVEKSLLFCKNNL